jgi:2-dehydropantoate 2-reductase
MADTQFAILGAGAMGTIVGAHLARAGHSVVMLVRERRAQQIQSDGLRLKGLADFAVKVPTLTRPEALKSADVLIVTTKAIGTAAALAPLQNAAIGTALSIQNGVMKNELLASALPHTHILGALANFSGGLQANGEVLFTRNVNLMLGELDDTLTSRATELAKTIDASGLRSTAVNNIRSQEWSKFVAWVGLVALSVTTRADTWKYLSDPGGARFLVRLLRELGALARTCGVPLTDEAMFPVATMLAASEDVAVEMVREQGEGYRKNSPTHKMSTLQDLQAHRPLELEETLGYAVQKAQQLNLQLPLLEATYQLVSAVAHSQLAR